MYAAKAANNLSELALLSGDLPQALTAARQSVEMADRSGECYQRLRRRATLADALHQTGCLTEAAVEIRLAEALQREWQSQIPLLSSLPGFRYCDLLLSQKQWQEVTTCAVQAIEHEDGRLLDIALNQLALGRAHLGLAQQVEGSSTTDVPAQHLAQAADWLQRAVDGLRQAGQQQYTPLGLLARAEWARVAKQFDQARRDLAEAFTIAERGEMRLHLADCYLEFARLSLATGDAASARKAWETAKTMVDEMGYHRRDGEVKEIEGQL